jgi:two-component system OmpR family response regulator
MNRRCRILVVDDDPVIRDVLAAILRRAGYDADLARDGEEAWRGLKTNQPYDLVITDEMMPVLKGSDLAARVRSEGRTIPIIIMSGGAGGLSGTTQGAWGAVQAFVPKPFAMQELLAAVSRVLLNHLTTGHEVCAGVPARL